MIEIVPSEEKNYIEDIVKILNGQREKGIASYGKRLEDNTELNNTRQIIIESLQEIADAAMYLCHALNALEEGERNG